MIARIIRACPCARLARIVAGIDLPSALAQPGPEHLCQYTPVVRAAWRGLGGSMDLAAVDACSDEAVAWLNQPQFCGPLDGRPAIGDVEFTVDTLGMGADRAQADHQFTGDLRPGKLGLEQAEHVQLTPA